MTGAKMSAGQWGILILAMGLHLVAGFFFLVSGLAAPLWAVILLLVIWAALLAWGYSIRRKPLVLLVPFAAAAVWFAVVQGGSMIFGWTA
ncbi:MAG TPA: hypothetical protein VHI31_07620 [Actinomycetota bacterium]|nr:hypothetical protein [Actinomycetota bacterium]